ncbi:uncharacterized protein LOC117299058 [Asterias rubens]|uniref:uncharacterized protein LOC117299058 n=1 Tax=Asterias rubens TaxID=7604 RepID=UPI001455B377|nr:uncharacterized protein LOC117299058 [Asterias rubens]
MLPVTRIPAVLVLSLFSLAHIHARHTTIHPGVQGLSDTKTSYKYIDKLSLSNDNRREFQEILLDAGAQHEKLLAECQAETYRPLTIDERISEAQVLLLTNLPAAATLLKDTLSFPEISTEQVSLKALEVSRRTCNR